MVYTLCPLHSHSLGIVVLITQQLLGLGHGRITPEEWTDRVRPLWHVVNAPNRGWFLFAQRYLPLPALHLTNVAPPPENENGIFLLVLDLQWSQ